VTRFRISSERDIFSDHYLRVLVADVEAPDGSHHERTIVRTRGAVGVVPVLFDPEGVASVVLVRQFRTAVGAELLEIPAGIRDVDGEPPEDTARRELIEEAGFRAGRLALLTRFHNTAGWSDANTYVYLATDLAPVDHDRQGAEEEHMTVVHLGFDEAVERVRAGEITDAKTVIGLLLAAPLLG